MLYPPKMSITCWNSTMLLGSRVQPSFFLHFTHPHPALCSTSSTFIVHGFYHVSYPSGTMFMAKTPPAPRSGRLSAASPRAWDPAPATARSAVTRASGSADARAAAPSPDVSTPCRKKRMGTIAVFFHPEPAIACAAQSAWAPAWTLGLFSQKMRSGNHIKIK